MNYAKIIKNDIANGLGVRVSLFVSGCEHRCEGCFNSEAWDFDHGEPFDEKAWEELLKALDKSFIRGLTLLGGEPLHEHNQKAVLSLTKRVREQFPNKDIWCYTGYSFEDIAAFKIGERADAEELLSLFDVVVDGPYVKEQKDLRLRFRGSANQRIIDVKRSIEEGGVIEFDLEG